MSTVNLRDLPLPAQCAIEYLDCQGEKSIAKLDLYLDHYFTVMALPCDNEIRSKCHQLVVRRFGLTGEAANGVVISAPGDDSIPGDDEKICSARITPTPRSVLDPKPGVWVYTADGRDHLLLAFEPGSMQVPAHELIGLTMRQGREKCVAAMAADIRV